MAKNSNNATLGIIGIIVLFLLTSKKSGKALPTPGPVTSAFGNRIHPITGQPDFHNGIDISAPNGTLIRAPWSGKVKAKYYNAKGGNQLIITHDNGYTTGYAHLDQTYPFKIGEAVAERMGIATVGMTGGATGPHLHFTLYDSQGNNIDPLSVFTT